MNKHSKGDTWRIRQSGLGGGFRVRSARPQYRVVQLLRLSPEAAYRYKVVLYANRRSVEEASLAFGSPISTIYRWRARFNRTVREEFGDRHHGPFDLATLQRALRAWKIAYHTDRPHSALGYATPMDYLHSHDFSDVSN